VRRADDAAGHAAELALRGPRAGPNGAGAFAGDVAEGAPEGAQAFPARLERDLGDGQVGIAQQRRRGRVNADETFREWGILVLSDDRVTMTGGIPSLEGSNYSFRSRRWARRGVRSFRPSSRLAQRKAAG
jgi:hypothetical protein